MRHGKLYGTGSWLQNMTEILAHCWCRDLCLKERPKLDNVLYFNVFKLSELARG